MPEQKSYTDLLTGICQGLAAYQGYLAACQMRHIESEYLFYEPIARIASAKGWTSKCEVPVKKPRNSKGDHKRVDFIFSKNDQPWLLVEVKYIKGRSESLKSEVTKFNAKEFADHLKIVIILGKLEYVKNWKLVTPIKLEGKICKMSSGGIKYGSRWYEVDPSRDGRTASRKRVQ